MSSAVAAPAGAGTYWRVNLALFLAGFATFSLIYCVQPLLPVFAREFGVGAAQSALALSLTTGFLAFAIVFASALCEGRDRRRFMFWSMATAALCNLVAALVADWHGLLLARALAGLCFGGVPAVALAYLAEEVEPERLGASVGLYVGGTAIGGMIGRIGTSIAADAWSWHAALAGLSVLDLLAALGFLALLPASRRAVPRRVPSPLQHVAIWRRHLLHERLPLLFLCGALSMGVFVALYNYAGFRLTSAPFNLTAAQSSFVFLAYLFGSAGSSFGGRLADRHGPAPVLLAGIALLAAGVLLSLWPALAGAIGGLVLITIGFFMSHAVASGWVGRLAGAHKGHAAALYLLAYYLGSSVLGAFGGWFWQHGGWASVCEFALLGLAMMLWCVLRLRAGDAARVSAAVPMASRG